MKISDMHAEGGGGGVRGVFGGVLTNNVRVPNSISRSFVA